MSKQDMIDLLQEQMNDEAELRHLEKMYGKEAVADYKAGILKRIEELEG